MSRSRIWRTTGRVAALVLLLTVFVGPWTFDTHPSTQDACPAPGVWLGNGRCSCLQSPVSLIVASASGGGGLAGIVGFFSLLPLAFVSTLLILLVGERRWLRAWYLAAWALLAVLSALVFALHWSTRGPVSLRLWGVWLCVAVAIAVLAGEILAGGLRTGQEPRPATAGAGYE